MKSVLSQGFCLLRLNAFIYNLFSIFVDSQGPRDAVVKEVLKHLLTFDSFEQFSIMMNKEFQVYKEKQENYDISNGNEYKIADGSDDPWKPLIDPESGATYYWNELTGETSWEPPQYEQDYQQDSQPAAPTSKPESFAEVYNALLNMGFPPAAIVSAMNASQGNFSFDDLVFKLSSECGDGSQAYDLELALRLSESQQPSAEEGEEAIPASTNQTMADYFILFVTDLSGGQDSKSEWLNDAAVELNAKFSMASSVLDTFDEEDDSSEGVVKLITWAKDMRQLHSDIISAYNQSIPYKEMTEHYPGGLLAWYEDLEAQRTSVDENSVAGNMLSDAELKRIAELDQIAGESSYS